VQGETSGGSGAAGIRGVALNSGSYCFYAQNNGSSGTYGPFTGSHDVCIDKSLSGTPEIGDVLGVVSVKARRGVSDVLMEVVTSTAANQGAFGVFVGQGEFPVDGSNNRPSATKDLSKAEYAALKASHNLGVVNSVGEGQINVCSQGGDIALYDMLTTSGVAGKAMRDDVRDPRYTVAKALEPVDWASEPESVKMIACVYLCG
jgi:hypothetical protein